MNSVSILHKNLSLARQTNKCSFQLNSNKKKNDNQIRRQLVQNSFGKDAIDSWLDITQFVAKPSSSGSVFETLSSRIGDRVYVDLNGWHLYLRDLKINQNASMADMLANSIGTSPKDQLKEQDIESLLRKVPVKLGGGKTIISLYEVIPEFALGDLYEICEDFVDDKL